MSTYRVVLVTAASTYITVEAASAEEAESLAYEQVPYVCAQCSGWGQRAGVELGGNWETEEVEQVD